MTLQMIQQVDSQRMRQNKLGRFLLRRIKLMTYSSAQIIKRSLKKSLKDHHKFKCKEMMKNLRQLLKTKLKRKHLLLQSELQLQGCQLKLQLYDSERISKIQQRKKTLKRENLKGKIRKTTCRIRTRKRAAAHPIKSVGSDSTLSVSLQ